MREMPQEHIKKTISTGMSLQQKIFKPSEGLKESFKRTHNGGLFGSTDWSPSTMNSFSARTLLSLGIAGVSVFKHM